MDSKAFISSVMGVGVLAIGVGALAQVSETGAKGNSFPNYATEAPAGQKIDREAMKEKIQNMSEEERANFKENMKEKMKKWGKKGKRDGIGFGKGLKKLHNNENVEISVEKLENGVRKTVTVTDETVLTKIKTQMAEHEAKRAESGKTEKEGLTKVVEQTENGFVMTITSTDEEKVAKMHEKAGIMELKKSITREVVNTATGVVITMTTANAEALEMMLAKNEERQNKEKREREGVSKKVTVISNGIEIKIDGETAEQIEKIQSNGGEMKRGRGKRGGRK